MSPFYFVYLLSFSKRSEKTFLICDKNISATFISIMNSLSNFSRIFLNPIFSYLLSYMNFYHVVIVVLLYNTLYYIYVFSMIESRLKNLKREDFTVSNIGKIKTN